MINGYDVPLEKPQKVDSVILLDIIDVIAYKALRIVRCNDCSVFVCEKHLKEIKREVLRLNTHLMKG